MQRFIVGAALLGWCGAVSAATTIQGSGEFRMIYLVPDVPGGRGGTVDLQKLFFLLQHGVTDDLAATLEVSLSHAFVQGASGDLAVDRAHLDYRLFDDRLALRGGVILVPMGYVNQHHGPLAVHGVARPATESRIIPTNWSEGGLGVFGALLQGLSYELYVMSGLNPLGFDASNGIAGGRQRASEAFNKRAPAGAFRLQYDLGIAGLVVGGSGYYAQVGGNAGPLYDEDGDLLKPKVPVLGLSADVVALWQNLQVRGVFASFTVGNNSKLRDAFDVDSSAVGTDVGHWLYGYYVEAAYTYSRAGWPAFVPFVRYEQTDTMAAIYGRERTAADDAQDIIGVAFGLSVRPVDQVALKADVLLQEPKGSGTSAVLYNLGVAAEL